MSMNHKNRSLYGSRDEAQRIYHQRREINKMKESIRFCLKSINQERLTSTDERTRKEMTTCYEILKKLVG